MRTARAVEKREIRKYSLAGPRESDRQSTLHPVEIECLLIFLASHYAYPISRMRRHKDFRIDPGDLNMGSVRDIHRQGTRRGTECVGIVLGAFVALSNSIDDPKETDRLSSRAHRFHNNQVIKFNLIFSLYADPEFKRCSVLRTQNKSFDIALGRRIR